MEVLVKWKDNSEQTWEPMHVIKQDDPITLAEYAIQNNLCDTPGWKWTKQYMRNKLKVHQMIRRMCRKKTSNIKYMFGLRIPQSIKGEYELDKKNGNTKWSQAIQEEITKLQDRFNCFHIAEEN